MSYTMTDVSTPRTGPNGMGAVWARVMAAATRKRAVAVSPLSRIQRQRLQGGMQPYRRRYAPDMTLRGQSTGSRLVLWLEPAKDRPGRGRVPKQRPVTTK